MITKIADFGLSDVTDKLAQSKKLVFVGTRGYMSPEIVSPIDLENYSINKQNEIIQGVTTGACDIFSVGVILWQMIYGVDSIPFDEARKNDSKYYYIRDNNPSLFWKCHPNVKKFHNTVIHQFPCDQIQTNHNLTLVKQMKQLFFKFFTFNPSKRITIDEIYEHRWYRMIEHLRAQEFVSAIEPCRKIKSK